MITEIARAIALGLVGVSMWYMLVVIAFSM